MENASKALIIAGSILIGLLVIGALILMYDQIGDYEKAQSNNDLDYTHTAKHFQYFSDAIII